MADKDRNAFERTWVKAAQATQNQAGLTQSTNNRACSPHRALAPSCHQPALQEHGLGHCLQVIEDTVSSSRTHRSALGTGPGFLYLVR